MNRFIAGGGAGRDLRPGRWVATWVFLVVAGLLNSGRADEPAFAASPREREVLAEALQARARPLRGRADLDALVTAASEARVVLLGEATHGTREFYEWRALLTRRLIEEHGVRRVGVEGDWRSLLHLNTFLAGDGGPGDAAAALRKLNRWPEWMWANQPFAALLDWIRDWNLKHGPGDQVNVFGMDLYGHEQSLAALDRFFRRWHPEHRKTVRRHYRVLRRFWDDGFAYSGHVQGGGSSGEAGAKAVLRLLASLDHGVSHVPEQERFWAEQDARVVASAEAFYRTNALPTVQAWNHRAEHMWGTVRRMLQYAGDDSKAVIWAHNTHVGDARATDLGTAGMVNIGALSRQALGMEAVYIVGFSTYRGDVMAGPHWGTRGRVYKVPSARSDSWDAALQHALGGDAVLLFDKESARMPALIAPRPQRAIGVVFDPAGERTAHYTQSRLSRRYDALLFISETHALKPLR